MESLESRLVFSLSPTGLEQETLELLNRMRANPSDELEQIFLSTDSGDTDYFTTADSDVNLALDFFDVDDATLFSQWGSLQEAPPLAWSEALYDAAEAHSEHMILQQLQSHQLPADSGLGLAQEDSLLDRVVAAGYNWSGSVRVGENVFAYTESVFHGHAAFAIDWGNTATGIQDPAGHRDNMMDAGFQEIGISIVAHEPTSPTDVGPLVVTADFGVRGNYGNARALGVVFEDMDGDDFYDAGEGLGGITITISNASNNYTTTTMTAGGWQKSVAAGTYDVVASGGSLTTALSMGSIVVGSDNVKVDLNTANAATTGDITGTVFHDTDGDSNIDAGESRLAGWVVFADEDGDGSLDTGEVSDVTDSNGLYELLAIDPGTVTVTVVDQMGYRPTYPSPAAEAVTVVAGTTNSNVNFGQYQFFTQSGSTATVLGTGQDDVFTWQAGSTTHTVTVNGDEVTISLGTISSIVLDAGNGNDSITLTGDANEESFLVQDGTVGVTGNNYAIDARKFETGEIHSGGDVDSIAYLYDSSSNDIFTATDTSVEMVGGGYDFTAYNFNRAHGRSTAGGDDYAYLYDGVSNDVFSGRADYTILQGSANEFYVKAQGFDRVIGLATAGGADVAYLYDEVSDDLLVAKRNNTVLRGNNFEFYNKVNGFESVYAFATGGNDLAQFYDSTADDTFTVEPGEATMTDAAGTYINVGQGFAAMQAFSDSGGADTVAMYDSTGNDTFSGRPDYSAIASADGTYDVLVDGFSRVIAHKINGGTDYAYLYDGQTDDRFIGRSGNAVLRDLDYTFYNKVNGFDRAIGFATEGGDDHAYLYDSPGDDRLTAKAKNTVMRSENDTFYNKVNNFEKVFADSSEGGNDQAYLYDADTDDHFSARSEYVVMRATDDSFYNQATGFAETYAYADGEGSDLAAVFDSAGDDVLTAHADYGTISGTDFYHFFAYFNEIEATASLGNDSAYLYDSDGDDEFVGVSDSAYLSGVNFYNRAIGFDLVCAIGNNGGNNTLSASSIDYVLEQVGTWL